MPAARTRTKPTQLPAQLPAQHVPLSTKLLAAGTAACIADLITFPLDTAKVRLQVCTQLLLCHCPYIMMLATFLLLGDEQ